MTNTLRAYKLSKLESKSNYIHHINNETNDDRWTLRWPSPRDRQTAEIDVKSGKIIRYTHINGTEAIDCDPVSWVSTIDRRINYLWQQTKKETSI